MARRRINSGSSGFMQFITIVLVILSVLLFIGIWSDSESKKPNPDSDKDTLEDKVKRRAELEAQIEQLKPNRESLLQKERSYFLWARISIGFLLITANVGFALASNRILEIGTQVDFNGAILLGYSFIAFLISGTPTRFAKTIRSAVIRRLRMKHIHIFMELEMLEKELKELDREIGEARLKLSKTKN